MAIELATGGGSPSQIFPGVTITGDPLPAYTQQIAQCPEDPAVGLKVPVLSGFDYDGNRGHDRSGPRRPDDGGVPRPLVPALQP